MNALRPLTFILVLCAFPAAGEGGVVINEVLYHAPPGWEQAEFIEIHNSTAEAVDLSGWRFTRGVRYQFPAGRKIEPQGYLVLSRGPERFREAYGLEAAGSYEGKLGRNLNHLELCDGEGKIRDAVRFSDSPPWPQGPDGRSASLERICPQAPSDLPQNWAGSPLSPDGLKPAGTPGKRNASHSANLPPVITDVRFSPPSATSAQAVTVEAEVRDQDGIRGVSLLYRAAGPGFEGEENRVEMSRTAGDRYSGAIPPQAAGRLVRFQVQSVDETGGERLFPSRHEPRPAISFWVKEDSEPGTIPLAWIVHTDREEFQAAEKRRGSRGRGRFNEDDQRRWMAREMLESGVDLAQLWSSLVLEQDLSAQAVVKLQPVLAERTAEWERTMEMTIEAPDLKEKMETIPEAIQAFRTGLREKLAPVLGPEEGKKISGLLEAQAPGRTGGPPRWTPERVLRRVVDLEGTFFRLTSRSPPTESRLAAFRKLFRKALEERGAIAPLVQKVMTGEGDFGEVQEKAEALQERVLKDLALSPQEERELTTWRDEQQSIFMGRSGRQSRAQPRRRSAFIYQEPGKAEVQVFDFLEISERTGGYKVRFDGDRPLDGMTTVNLIYEYNDRFVLAEPLAYEVYRLAGNAAPLTRFVRLDVDGKLLGYHLLVEQPNRSFLRRNRLKDTGDLYKILWYERGVVRQHEKKTNIAGGHGGLIELVELLEKKKGDEAWEHIHSRFNVNQVINYFAVNLCLSHWDGFFNNYFTYHDVEGSGKWEMYPWDQDKTWGFHDGIQEGQVFHDMPVTFGMEGDVPPGWPAGRPPPRGFGGRSPWWRAGGYFSRPLLANPRFRKLYLARAREILEKVYTEEVFFPRIEEMGKLLEGEVRIRARALNEDPEEAAERLRRNLDSLREHLIQRRKFLLKNEEIRAAGRPDPAEAR